MPVKSYKDIVPKGLTFLDLPFKEILFHACEDADATFQLYEVLEQELGRRGVLGQYRSETLTLTTTLGKWEVEGIPVDGNRLSELRSELLVEVDHARKAVINSAGITFDLDAEEEVRRALGREQKIADLIGDRKATIRLLEELGACHPLPRLLVKFRRVQKQLRQVEGILRTVENGRIYPVFSQTSNVHGQLTSIGPNLFADFGHAILGSCFGDALKGHFRSSQKSLDIVENLSGDALLKKDRRAAGALGRFLKTEIVLDGVDHIDLLLSTMIGTSNSQLCRKFLCHRSTIASIRHDFELRYTSSFRWLEDYRKKTMRQGFAFDGDRRRWFSGLRSSNIAKRQQALDSAVRWLLRY
jgi:DNA polymerase I-like protein with 3'-5' exonuclease and polymerase domains